jgi:hypothetical protein
MAESRPAGGSGRTEVIRVQGGCVVAQETLGEDGSPWLTLTRLDDPDGSDEQPPVDTPVRAPSR